MLFNSIVFGVFFVVTYALYVTLRERRLQNRMLLVASYVFYGAWDWRFTSLIAVSTVVDYVVGQRLGRTEDATARRRLVTISVVSNLGILGFFKYFGFFAETLADLVGHAGIALDPVTLRIVLPVGISFYTFQTLSYTIDVYRRRIEPTRDFWDFALFVAFFPQLVAGPIERAASLLPQIARPRRVDWGQINAGLHLVTWGLFKKVVIADNAALHSDRVFNDIQSFTGLDLVLGALAFTLQIYGDFSGYSDIARGVAKLLGFELMVNFKLPYFAHSPSDFWRRWHVSLSSWLRDYLYISLGGNRGGAGRTYRNLMLTMLLGGLWHGASWNFVAWGAFHGLLLVVYRLVPWLGSPRAGTSVSAWATACVRVAMMFTLTVVGWVLFRCTEWAQIAWWFGNVGLERSAWTLPMALAVGAYWTPVLAVQAWQQARGDLLVLAKTPPVARALIHAGLVVGLLVLGRHEATEFIYFQF